MNKRQIINYYSNSLLVGSFLLPFDVQKVAPKGQAK